MAKGKTGGKSPSRDASDALRRELERRATSVVRRRRKVRRAAGGDAVHDLRVATRRLQEALAYYEPFLPRATARRVERRAKQIRRSLGERRDVEVAEALLVRLRRRVPERERVVVDDRLRELHGTEARRAAPFALPGIRKRIRSLLRAVPSVGGAAAARRGRRLILERLRTVRAALARAGAGRDGDMHRLRITIKRYRYGLEMTRPVIGADAREALVTARRLQERLGALHDLDVLRGLVRRAPRSRGRASLLRRLGGDRRRALHDALAALRQGDFATLARHLADPARR